MKILAFPRDRNPYQELLYTPMRAQGITVGYLEGPTGSHTLNLLLLPVMLTWARLHGYDTLHVHWTFPFMLPFSRGAVARACMEVWAAGFWLLAKLYGMQLVWTAHNARPHEPLFLNDARAHRLLGRLADRIIVHTEAARRQLADLGVSGRRMQSIPHGNYIGALPDSVTRRAARTRLGLDEGSLVLLFFGLIRPYKGVESLLSAFETSGDGAELLIAGNVQDAGLRQALENAAAKQPRIHLRLEYIPDDELQYLFRASDYTVLPYEKSTTSGVALLACSFGSPIIAPDLPAFAEIPEAAKIAYASGQLSEGLRRAAADSKETRGRQSRAARTYAESLSWDNIATRTVTFLQESPEART